MKLVVWVLVIGAVALALGLLTDLSRVERTPLAAVIGGALVIGFEVVSDRRARRAWEEAQRPGPGREAPHPDPSRSP